MSKIWLNYMILEIIKHIQNIEDLIVLNAN